MPAKIMDGRAIAREVKSKIKEQVGALKASKFGPTLATMIVGDNPVSRTYLRNIHTACSEVGIDSRNLELDGKTPQYELMRIIQRLNQDREVTGILLQLPLPTGLDDVTALSAISPEKDVDGLTPHNLGLLLQKSAKLVPCTPKGVMVMLHYYGVEVAGRHAVVINRSKVVGRPLSQLLLNEDATVTVCHSKTQNLTDITRQADILVTGIGRRSQFAVQADMIKPGAVVVDVGTSSVGGKLMGDVDFTAATEIASFISAVPGGVGPMTIAMLLYNTLVASCLQNRLEPEFNPDKLKAAQN